jgi:hypothetical protein
VLHYNCQKHYFKQQLDHFAAESSEQDPGPNSEAPKNRPGGPGYQSGLNDLHYHQEVQYDNQHGNGNGHHGYGDDAPDQYEGDHPGLGHELEHLYDVHDRDRDERKRAKKMKKQAKQINQIKKSVKMHKMEVERTAGVLSFSEDFYNGDSDVRTAGIEASMTQQRLKLGPSWKPPAARRRNQQADRQALDSVAGAAVLRPTPGALIDSSDDAVAATWLEEQQASAFETIQELHAPKEADFTPEQQALLNAASDTLPDAPDADYTDTASLQQGASVPAWKWNTLYSLVADSDSTQAADGQGLEGATDAAAGVAPTPLGASDAAADASDGQQQADVQAEEEEGVVFKQVYWVCDAAWPTEPKQQVCTRV